MSNPIAKVSLYRFDGELRGTVLRTYEGASLLPLGDHDVYAAPVTAANQPEPVNQQTLAALEALVAIADNGCADAWRGEWDDARAAIAAAEAAQPEKDTRAMCMLVAEAAYRCATGRGAVQSDVLRQIVDDVLQQPASAQPVAVLPKYDCFSRDDGDSWEEHPASDCFVHGRKLGDEFELLAGWTAERVTFRVTKVPDEESDDYEVEQVTPQKADVLRCASQVLIDALEKLARLGAGDRYGNSDGNVIAQQALAEFRAQLSAAKKTEGV